MKSVNNKILVEVDLSQKDKFTLAGITVSTANKYETNYREKSPTVCCVVEGNNTVSKGDILLCHHNLFYLPSPFHVEGNLFSIPFSSVLFAKIKDDGTLHPICGNMICERVVIHTDFKLPTDQIETYIDRSRVVDAGVEKIKKDTIIFHRPHAGYDMVYTWNDKVFRVTKVDIEQVCGTLYDNLPIYRKIL